MKPLLKLISRDNEFGWRTPRLNLRCTRLRRRVTRLKSVEPLQLLNKTNRDTTLSTVSSKVLNKPETNSPIRSTHSKLILMPRRQRKSKIKLLEEKLPIEKHNKGNLTKWQETLKTEPEITREPSKASKTLIEPLIH